MTILKLTAHFFRNLNEVNISLTPSFNLFYGHNAAGKTSLLELVYYLGLIRSFRTQEIASIIQHHAKGFVLCAEINQQDSPTRTILGVERTSDGSKRIHVDGQAVTSLTTLTRLLPLKLISTDTYRFFYDGPKNRRQYLDWGVFHVKPTYHHYWRQWQWGLKQRNAALRQGLAYKDVLVWDQQLTVVAEELDKLRLSYLDLLQPELDDLLQTLVKEHSITLQYKRGWTADKPLIEVLKDSFVRDQKLGYTQYGPHRADLQLFINKVIASDYLSQGQQKVVTYALHLAQGQLLKKHTTISPIYLIDDIASELDRDRLKWVVDVLMNMQAQTLITAIHSSDFDQLIDLEKAYLFHVKQGSITMTA